MERRPTAHRQPAQLLDGALPIAHRHDGPHLMPHLAKFFDFIFLANSMAYAENRQNGGLTKFCQKARKGLPYGGTGEMPIAPWAVRGGRLLDRFRGDSLRHKRFDHVASFDVAVVGD